MFCERLNGFTKIFCERTAIHGFKYLQSEKTTKIEKIFWAVSLLISLVFTVLLIHQFFIKVNKNPIVVFTESNPIPVTEINFPAMSMCPSLKLADPALPQNKKINDMKLLEFIQKSDHDIKVLQNSTLLKLKYLQVASLITGKHVDILNSLNVKIPTDDFVEILSEFPNFWTYFEVDNLPYAHQLEWLLEYDVNMTYTLSRSGTCYTFNMVSPDKLFKTDEFSKDFNSSKIIRFLLTFEDLKRLETKFIPPIKTTHPDLGLSGYFFGKIFDRNSEEYDLFEFLNPLEKQKGIQLVFHDPFELPSNGFHASYTSSYYHFFYLLNAEMTSIDESLIGYKPEDRNCYLPGEKELKFFKVYTKRNCEHECLAEKTLEKCSCVQFFQVRNNLTRICGVTDYKCFKKVEENFKDDCQCFEPCENLKYNIELSVQQLYLDNYYETAYLGVVFKDDEIFVQKRKEYYTSVQIFSIVGGLSGLLIGFSFISTAEFIYFLFVALVGSQLTSRIHPTGFTARKLCQFKENFFVDYFIKFMKKSSVHTISFIAGENTKLRKLFWILIFTSSIVAFQLLSSKTFSLYFTSVAVTQSGNPKSVKTIPFPAVTFFGATFYLEFAVKSLHKNESADEEMYRWALIYNALCESYFRVPGLYEYHFSDLSFLENSTIFMEYFNSKHLDQRRDFFNKSKLFWNRNFKPTFVEILTRHATGNTFNLKKAENLLNLDEVHQDFRYETEGLLLHTSGRPEFGLEMDVWRNYTPEPYSQCLDSGFLIHSPDEIPALFIEDDSIAFFYGGYLELSVVPKVTETDESLRSLSPKDRQCYFDGEFKLKYFKTYTKRSCEAECVSDRVYEDRGCIPFSYIRNSSMRICGMTRKMYANELRLKILTEELCDHCLPTCNDVNYNFNLKFQAVEDKYDDHKLHSASVKIKFEDEEFYPFLRYQPLSLKDFLPSIGGLLGLFAGISFLSIVEVVYFFTIRLFTDSIRHFKNDS